jgi:hypothetical protein
MDGARSLRTGQHLEFGCPFLRERRKSRRAPSDCGLPMGADRSRAPHEAGVLRSVIENIEDEFYELFFRPPYRS